MKVLHFPITVYVVNLGQRLVYFDKQDTSCATALFFTLDDLLVHCASIVGNHLPENTRRPSTEIRIEVCPTPNALDPQPILLS